MVKDLMGGFVIFSLMTVLAILVTGLVTSCGKELPTDQCIEGGTKCHGKENPDDRSLPEKGDQGIPGAVGSAGPSGRDGSTGERGATGDQGIQGQGCTVTGSSSGATVTCPDGTTTVINNGSNGTNGSNGSNGQDGQDGADAPLAITEIVDVCGDAPNIQDEVLLRLGNGKLIVLFADNSNGKNPRLSVLSAGNYITSDGSNCFFTVTSTNQITNEHY